MCFRDSYSSVFSCIDAILQVKKRHNILCIMYHPQAQHQWLLAVGAPISSVASASPMGIAELQEKVSAVSFPHLSGQFLHMWQHKHCSQDVKTSPIDTNSKQKVVLGSYATFSLGKYF